MASGDVIGNRVSTIGLTITICSQGRVELVSVRVFFFRFYLKTLVNKIGRLLLPFFVLDQLFRMIVRRYNIHVLRSICLLLTQDSAAFRFNELHDVVEDAVEKLEELHVGVALALVERWQLDQILEGVERGRGTEGRANLIGI